MWLIDLDGGAPTVTPDDVVLVRADAITTDPRVAAAIRKWQNIGCLTVLFDPDPRATVGAHMRHPQRPVIEQVESFDLVVLYGDDATASRRLATAYEDHGAPCCIVLEPAVNADRFRPSRRDDRYVASVAWLGRRSRDEGGLWDAFVQAAAARPQFRFIAGGPDQADTVPPNLRFVEYTAHVGLACAVSADLVVVPTDAGADAAPVTSRLLAAAATGACIVTDAVTDATQILPPGRAFFTATDARDLLRCIDSLDPPTARRVGGNARSHVLHHHVFDERVARLLRLVRPLTAPGIRSSRPRSLQ